MDGRSWPMTSRSPWPAPPTPTWHRSRRIEGLPIAGWAAVNEGEASGEVGDEPVSGVVAVDDHTLTIETEEPFALLPKVLTYPLFAPVAVGVRRHGGQGCIVRRATDR